MNLILLGPPGSGKGTHGEYLENTLGLIRISTGDLLREEVAKQTKLGKQLEESIGSGKLVSDEIVISILNSKIHELSNGFILDGFPRTVTQAEKLNSMLDLEGKKIDFALNFQVSDEVIIDRITSRFFCANCKATYNKLYKKPQKEGVCDMCGGTKFLVREDDKEETVRKRLEEYREKTLPLANYYEEHGLLQNIDASGAIKDIRHKIDLILSKSH